VHRLIFQEIEAYRSACNNIDGVLTRLREPNNGKRSRERSLHVTTQNHVLQP